MRYAIDRYTVGKEIEVRADRFDDSKVIPLRTNRFYCPECGELVFFRKGGGFQSSHFYHQEKTSQTPECVLRVDGRSGLSLSQRVGLSIFLRHSSQGHFQLCIGFPPLETRLLDRASKEQWEVSVNDGTKNSTWLVNHSNFIADETTLLPVDFIPSHGKNYQIFISGKGNLFEIQRKWSDYADGFSKEGAIFIYDENCGKKVKRGDSISTNRSYYVVSKSDILSFSNVEQERVGILSVGRDNFNIYVIEINLSADDYSFNVVANYYNRLFGVWLLESAPELIPIWPPITLQDYLIPVAQKPNIICAVSSGNKTPNVYEYSDYGVSYKEMQHNYNGVYTVEIAVGLKPVTLSVDRKYVGREISFLSKTIPYSNYSYAIEMKSESGNKISFFDINREDLSSGFTIFSNSKMELFACLQGQSFRHFCLRSHETAIPPMQNTEELYFVVDSFEILNIKRKQDLKSKNRDDEELVKKINKAKRSQMLPIPYWAGYIIRRQRITNNEKLYYAIISTIKNGCIPAEVLRLLCTVE